MGNCCFGSNKVSQNHEEESIPMKKAWQSQSISDIKSQDKDPKEEWKNYRKMYELMLLFNVEERNWRVYWRFYCKTVSDHQLPIQSP
jgi:hypothetical protein